MLELELDGAIGGGDGGLGEHGVRVGDVVRVGGQPRGGEGKRVMVATEGKGVEGVVVRVGKGVQVAVGGEEEEGGLEGRLWV